MGSRHQPPGPTRDGRHIRVPWNWFPILRDALPDERSQWELSRPEPVEILFSQLNAEVTVDQLLAWRDGADEESHIVASSTPERRLSDAAALIRATMRKTGLSFEECVTQIRQHPLIADDEDRKAR